MGLLDPVNEDTSERSTWLDTKKDDSAGSQSRVVLIVALLAVVAVVVLIWSDILSAATAGLMVSAFLNLVILFALSRLFVIADNSKAILSELQRISKQLEEQQRKSVGAGK